MIPIQYKLMIGAAMLVGAFLFGVKYEKGQNAIDEVKVVTELVDDQNKDIVEIAENEKVMEKVRVEYKERIVYLPAIPTDSDCPVDQSTELRNEAYGSLPDLYFESSN